MFYQPEVIVYLMLLPITFLIVIPSFLSVFRIMIGVLRTERIAEPHENVGSILAAEA